MKTQTYPTDMTDRQWQCITDLIPPPKPGGRPRSLDMRQVINAILYILVSGIQWRMLPKEYPKWQRVYHYFRQWRDDGTWQRIHDTLRAEVRRQTGRHTHPTAGAVDSQSVKTTQVPGERGDDSGKQVKGRKRHLLVDTLGLLLVVVVTAASVSEHAGARRVRARLGGSGKKLRRVWVDGVYRGTLLDWAWDHCRLILRAIAYKPLRRFVASGSRGSLHHRYEPHQPIVRNNPAVVRSSARDIRENTQIGDANAVSSHACRAVVLQNGMLHND
jgi:putative transposase